jgi:hypothetical protein
LSFGDLVVMIVFFVRRGLEFGSTYFGFNLGLLGLLPFYHLASGGWDIREIRIGLLGVS